MGVAPMTNQQFANDTMLFSQSNRHEARTIKLLLSKYCEALGQQIN